VTCAAATVPTVPTMLAMQGMASLATDLLHFPVAVAIALAGFLELALVSFALLTRASALAGRPGGVDAAAVWGVSLASGAFSALHELVGPAIGGTRSWEADPGSLLAAGVRLTAPLVAALLWERVLTAARREHEARSLVEVRRDRRLIAVAQAALVVRQLAEDRPYPRRHTGRSRRARRRLQRAHVAALRIVGPGQDLFEVLAAVGAVDILPAATIPTRRPDTRPDTPGAPVPAVLSLSDTGSDTPAVLAGGAATGSDTLDGDPSGADTLFDIPTAGPDTRGAHVPAVLFLSATPPVPAGAADTGSDTLDGDPSRAVHLSDTGSDTLAAGLDTRGAHVPAVLALSDTGSDTSGAVSDTPVGSVVVPDPLSIAVELVRHDRQVAGPRIADAMRRHGHTVTDRTGLRWRDRAVNHLATELNTDLSDASNDEVRLVASAAG
jgi:hypothetical protein